MQPRVLIGSKLNLACIFAGQRSERGAVETSDIGSCMLRPYPATEGRQCDGLDCKDNHFLLRHSADEDLHETRRELEFVKCPHLQYSGKAGGNHCNCTLPLLWEGDEGQSRSTDGYTSIGEKRWTIGED